MSLEDVIGSHATGYYVVTRTPERDPTYVDGKLVPSSASIELTITAVNATLDTLTSAGHGLVSGDGPVRVLASASSEDAPDLPKGLSVGVEYWAILVDVDTIKLAASEADALADIEIDLIDVGTVPFVASSTRFMLQASVQPYDGRSLSADDDVNRTSEDKLCLVVEELFTQKPGRDADSVEVDGDAYTVTDSEKWNHWGGRHYECIISRDEVT